jgi:putative hydrolase of the HAD superfamily
MADDNHEPFDWTCIDLVAFDVDGTLYDQRSLRLRVLAEMIPHAVYNRHLRIMPIIRTYRRLREQFGDEEVADFEPKLVSETASSVGCSKDVVESIVAEWIERRPLRHLSACRYPGLRELFAGLRRSGKTIGVLSDYPARKKLLALGLDADVVVCAGDEEVGQLKPHPRGLEVLMTRTGVTGPRTVLIGDRIERDGFAARRAGAKCLIRCRKPKAAWVTFDRYDAPLFAPFLARN